MENKRSELAFIEELRSIAQLGLNYTKDPFDKNRYERLLEIVAEGYSQQTHLSSLEVMERLQREVGHVTPKVGVNGVLFDSQGRILLSQRTDDKRWELPGGWADLNESPRQAIARELHEELSIHVDVGDLIEVTHRLPGEFGQLHTSYHLAFHCVLLHGKPSTSSEVMNFGYFSASENLDWHRDHKVMVDNAFAYLAKKTKV